MSYILQQSPWRRKWQLPPVFLPGSLTGYIESQRVGHDNTNNNGHYTTKFLVQQKFQTHTSWRVQRDPYKLSLPFAGGLPARRHFLSVTDPHSAQCPGFLTCRSYLVPKGPQIAVPNLLHSFSSLPSLLWGGGCGSEGSGLIFLSILYPTKKSPARMTNPVLPFTFSIPS